MISICVCVHKYKQVYTILVTKCPTPGLTASAFPLFMVSVVPLVSFRSLEMKKVELMVNQNQKAKSKT